MRNSISTNSRQQDQLLIIREPVTVECIYQAHGEPCQFHRHTQIMTGESVYVVSTIGPRKLEDAGFIGYETCLLVLQDEEIKPLRKMPVFQSPTKERAKEDHRVLVERVSERIIEHIQRDIGQQLHNFYAPLIREIRYLEEQQD